MDNDEMALEAMKVIRLRDSLLRKDTKDVKRLKVEKKIRNRYNSTSDYKKLLKSGRIDLIDKTIRAKLFTPYEKLRTAYYDYYKPRKQRSEEVKTELETIMFQEAPTTNSDFYDEDSQPHNSTPIPSSSTSQQVLKNQQIQQKQQAQQFGYFYQQQQPFTQIPQNSMSPSPSPSPFPMLFPSPFNLGLSMASNPVSNTSTSIIPPSNIGYLPPTIYPYLSPNNTGQMLPQQTNSAFHGIPSQGNMILHISPPASLPPPSQPPPPPPPLSYNPYNPLNHENKMEK